MERLSRSLPAVEIIRRADIPAIHSVQVGGELHVLGVLKDFRKHPQLRRVVPPNAGAALAWVHLDPGQVLDTHVHPVTSMILVCSGKVAVRGDLEATMEEGDTLLVPAGQRHGLCGLGPTGFWGLSLQFESRGLYENPSEPLVRFVDDRQPERSASKDPPKDGLDRVLDENAEYLARFDWHPLFALAASGALSDDKLRKRFLSAFQIWSDGFQRVVKLRAGLTEAPMFAEVADAHLTEELGHNRMLQGSTDAARASWDPILEAACSWFQWKMLTLGDPERVVLLHLVVESSAVVFYKHMASVFASARTQAHLNAHVDSDTEHVAMGVRILRRLPHLDTASLLDVQEQGWRMLTHVFLRVLDLTA